MLILFNREKANQICRLINFHMDAQSRDWKRTNKPESDPVVKNKSASLFVNAFQVLNQVLIITKHKCLIYDMYFNEEEKVINFEEFGRNQELKTILCFNESFSFS